MALSWWCLRGLLMQIRSTLNGGLAEVDDEFAAQLIEAGGWEAADKPVRKRRSHKPAPEKEPQNEE